MFLRLRNNARRRAQLTRLSRSVLLPRKILSVNRSKDGLANSACPAPWLLDGALSYSSSCFHWLQDFPSFYLHPMKQHCKTPHQIPHYLHHFFSPRLLLSPGYKRSVMRENSTAPAFLLWPYPFSITQQWSTRLLLGLYPELMPHSVSLDRSLHLLPIYPTNKHMLHVIIVSVSWPASPFTLSIHHHISGGECASTCHLGFRKPLL